MKRISLACLLVSVFVSASNGQTTIVDEDFEGYADETALHAVWLGNPGTGTVMATEDSFSLATDGGGVSADYNGDNFVDAADYVIWRKDNINGQAGYDAWQAQFGGPPAGGGPVNTFVDHPANTIGGNLVYGPDLDPDFVDGSIFPSQGFEPIVLTADIFTPSSSIQRNTIGLRHSNGTNIFEMGMYNANGNQPGNPDDVTGAAVDGDPVPPATTPQARAFASLGVRTQIFFNQTNANPADPDWQFFAFDPTWDTNANGLVTAFEAFSALGIVETGGWHTLEATFEPVEPGENVESGDVIITVTLDLLRDGMNNAQNTEGVDATITISNLRVSQDGFDSLRIGGPSQLSSTGSAGFDNILLTGPLVGGGAGSVTVVPEPSAIGLAMLAATGLALAWRRKRA